MLPGGVPRDSLKTRLLQNVWPPDYPWIYKISLCCFTVESSYEEQCYIVLFY